MRPREQLSSCSPHPGSPKTWQPKPHSTVTTSNLSPAPKTHSRGFTVGSTSHLNVPDLQWHRANLGPDDVVLSCLAYPSLQGLKLTVNVWEPRTSRGTTLHLKPKEGRMRRTHHKTDREVDRQRGRGHLLPEEFLSTPKILPH